LIFLAFLGCITACEVFEPALVPEDQLLDGPIEGLSFEENSRFLAGDRAFNDEIFTVSTGLGPLFVATSCGSCHPGDGKGNPFTTLTRFGQKDHSGNQYLQFGGPQLQHRAIPGYKPETIPAGASFSKFTPPANTGLGYLEAVSDETLLALADPLDLNQDGISGIPNYQSLPTFVQPSPGAIPKNGKYIHRFGKKAGAYNLLQQTVNAYQQDIGINSIFAPIDVYSGLEVDPEISTTTIQQVVFYLQTLKAPIPRNQEDKNIARGKTLFNQIGCASCHIPSLQTGPSHIKALHLKTFYPYTDLLLHDMGPGLDDGYTEGSALTSEWRTPPLWGLGLSPNSQGKEYFLLHDGRARSIRQAIELHGGEGANSQKRFSQLTPDDQAALLSFLESL
jgi:CxxC motif-containing protein (DUF1111 family)